MSKASIAYCMCGSFCTLSKAIDEMENLKLKGYDIYPVMSEITYSTDTKFGNCADINNRVFSICKREIIHSITSAEPIGPGNFIDLVVIAPCTGNTLSKLANGITDTAVTMAAKAQLRKNLPVVIALATNDALGATAKNIGTIYNTKNVYMVPIKQDNPNKKPNSMVCDFSKLEDTILEALNRRQYQPLFN